MKEIKEVDKAINEISNEIKKELISYSNEDLKKSDIRSLDHVNSYYQFLFNKNNKLNNRLGIGNFAKENEVSKKINDRYAKEKAKKEQKEKEKEEKEEKKKEEKEKKEEKKKEEEEIIELDDSNKKSPKKKKEEKEKPDKKEAKKNKKEKQKDKKEKPKPKKKEEKQKKKGISKEGMIIDLLEVINVD